MSKLNQYQAQESHLSLTTKENPKDKIEVEIGDSKQTDFKPQVKIKRFDNECNVSMRLIDNQEGTVSTEKDKIIWETKDKLAEFYELEPSIEHPEGGYEFEVTLNKKPETNKVEFTLVDKDVEYYYQPPLTKQDKESHTKRPENVIGSYAIYVKTPRANFKNGKEYKVGKIGHIYRPLIKDSSGNEVWGELNIEKDILKVSIPETFLNKANYPIKVDPTFGFDSKGSSLNYWTPYITQTKFTTSEAGKATSMTMYLHDEDSKGPSNVVMGIYNSSKAKQVQTSEDSIAKLYNNWKTISLTSAYDLADATEYWLCWQTSTGIYKYFDVVSNLTNLQYIAYNATMPATLVNSSTQSEKVSIYVTYELEVEGTNIQINIADSWKEVSGMRINISDSWKDATSAKINIGDSWKDIF